MKKIKKLKIRTLMEKNMNELEKKFHLGTFNDSDMERLEEIWKQLAGMARNTRVKNSPVYWYSRMG